MSGAINHALRGAKNNRHWETLIEFSLNDLTKHLESLFTKEMSWDVFAKTKDEIHIHHIIFQEYWKYTSPEDPEFKKCWALCNLMPMWKKDHILLHKLIKLQDLNDKYLKSDIMIGDLSMITKNFKTLCENTIQRYMNGGMLAGDFVTIRKTALNHPALSDRAENFKKLIQSMQNSDLNLKICAIKADRPSNSTIIGGGDSPCDLWADVVTELAPGSISNPVTLPLSVLKLQNDGTVYPPIPKSLIRKNPNNEIRQADEFVRTIDDSLKGEPLTRVNIQLSHAPKYDDTKPHSADGQIKAKEMKESIDTHENKSLSNLYVEDIFNKIKIPILNEVSLQTEKVQSLKKEILKEAEVKSEQKVITSDLSNVYEQFIQRKV